MASKSKSTKQVKDEKVARFNAWVEYRYKQDDWQDYVNKQRGDILNRSEIARECEFLPSAFKHGVNGIKEICELLSGVESDLLEKGVLKERIIKDPIAHQKSNDKKSSMRDIKLMKAEEENASLKARVRELEETLEEYGLMNDHMKITGRSIR